MSASGHTHRHRSQQTARLSTRLQPLVLALGLLALPAWAADAETLKALDDARKATAAAMKAADEARAAADAARAELQRLEAALAAAQADKAKAEKALAEKSSATPVAKAEAPKAEAEKTTLPKAAPSVTLYGVMHVSVDALDDGRSQDLAVSSNSSRLGIRGEKALNDEFTLSYLAEWQIGATEETTGSGGNNNLSRRNQWLGIKHEMGELRVGRIDTPIKNIRGKTDMFYSDQLGENRTITGVSGFDARFDNVVQLEIGTGALRGLLYYSGDTGRDAVDDNTQDAWSVAMSYDTPAWYLGVGYEERNNPNRTTLRGQANALRIASTLKIGEAGKLGLFWESAEDVGGLLGHDRDLWGFGYSHKTGDWTWKAAWYEADDRSDRADTGGSQIALGADRAFGKNTVGYITWAQADNDDQAAFKVIGVGHDGSMTVLNGDTNSGLSVGMRHQF